MSRFLVAAVLGLSLMTSVALVSAQPAPAAMQEQEHQWNDQEDHAWHRYLKEEHKKDHEWAKSTKKEQKSYWKWREKHSDTAQ